VEGKGYDLSELMIVTASRMLRDGETVLVGIDLPNVAANLAKRMHAPRLCMIYESGVVDASPPRLPLSIGDPMLVSRSVAVCSVFELFSYYLQGSKVDVGFLGGAQVDRFGNINSTVIGSYEAPKVRLGGSGGACDIAALARRTIIIVRHSLRTLPERLDFLTSPGYLGGGNERARYRYPGGGPLTVITDMGILGFDQESKEMVLEAIYPGVTVEQVRANTGWDLKVKPDLVQVEDPPPEYIACLREMTGATAAARGRRSA